MCHSWQSVIGVRPIIVRAWCRELELRERYVSRTPLGGGALFVGARGVFRAEFAELVEGAGGVLFVVRADGQQRDVVVVHQFETGPRLSVRERYAANVFPGELVVAEDVSDRYAACAPAEAGPG